MGNKRPVKFFTGLPPSDPRCIRQFTTGSKPLIYQGFPATDNSYNERFIESGPQIGRKAFFKEAREYVDQKNYRTVFRPSNYDADYFVLKATLGREKIFKLALRCRGKFCVAECKSEYREAEKRKKIQTVSTPAWNLLRGLFQVVLNILNLILSDFKKIFPPWKETEVLP